MTSATTTFSLAAFKKAGFVGKGGILLLSVGEASASALAALQRAIANSRDMFAAVEQEGIWISVDGAVMGPTGPIALVRECEPARALPILLDTITAQLDASGVAGRLMPAPRATDDWFGNRSYAAPGAVVLLPIDEPRLLASYDDHAGYPLHQGWLASPDATVAVSRRVLDWALEIPGDVLSLTRAGYTALRREGLVDYVTSAVRWSPLLISVTESETRRRAVRFSSLGCVAASDYNADVDHVEQLPGLVDLLTYLTDGAGTGLIREMSSSAAEQELLGSLAPASEILQLIGPNFWMTAGLDRQFVYDAYVAQVVTAAQWQRIGALPEARWSVSELSAGRRLVRHRAPELWSDNDPRPYGERRPHVSPVAPEVLRQARLDFGSAILGQDTLQANPPDLPPRAIDLMRHILETNAARI